MKQKLKEKFNVADKVKKTTFTKCVKMSKEVENLKNGVLNGDSVISNNHIQQHIKLNNSNVDTTTKAIVGGRLQFYKDGKFILELARAREGEKTGWISVPRKTFWPPTISTNSSTTFSKHESSTSLSYSDDNSSIQSSPWQRDHCWKQSRPRHNISKEMTFVYNRPTRLYLTGECQKIARLMRRRPLYKCQGNSLKFDNVVKKENGGENEVTSSSDKIIKEEKDDTSPNDSKESVDTLDNGNKRKLDKILKKLADRISTKLALNGNTNGNHASSNSSSNTAPTSYSLASHIANTINSTQPHQHVSPRKRILRELEKVSLEDTKRSRPKTTTATNGNTNTFSNGSLNNVKSTTTDKAPPPISRPISSYSITSLLAHNTSTSSSSSSSSALTGCNNNNINNNSINSNDSLSTSHYQQQPTPSQAKSPHLMHNNNIKRKSPNLNQSPSQSPSPEHHAFHKYRPITTTPTPASPYANSSYHSPNYMRGSPSPHDRLRTSGNFQHSPSSTHSQQNYGIRDSSLSPNVDRSAAVNSSSRSTPTSSVAQHSSGIRTVPKKTAALRQQFSSPTMETKKSTTPNVKSEKPPMDVEALLRPSALIAPPIPTLGHHPAAPLSHYPYIYPPMNYLPPAVPPYYPSFYNPAMLAAAAAAYRFPIHGYPSPQTPDALSYDKNANGHPSSSESATTPHSYVPTSPWNPISLANHHENNLVPKGKDEQSSDVPLNLSKH